MVPRHRDRERTNRRALTLAGRGRLFLAAEIEDGVFAFIHLVVALAPNDPAAFALRPDGWSERSAHAGLTNRCGRRFPGEWPKDGECRYSKDAPAGDRDRPVDEP